MTVECRDSRRLTGPNVISKHPGAVVDVLGPDSEIDPFVSAWKKRANKVLDAVGWAEQTTAHRRYPGGASLAITAPIDALYAATEVNEWAFEAAKCTIRNTEPPDPHEAAEQLRKIIAKEVNPALLALRDAAYGRGVAFLSDDEFATVGFGKGSQTFPVTDLPEPSRLDWNTIFNIPVALVTGTNGKTTTVRLARAMVNASGMVSGTTSTDGIVIGDEAGDQGDYSGPEGARTVLRDQRVEIAILETARGGLLRRGVSVGCNPVTTALVTNVGEDHLGEFGIADLGALAETKLIVHHAVASTGRLILNADDEEIAPRGALLAPPKAWFSLSPDEAVVRERLDRDGQGAVVLDGRFFLLQDGNRKEIASIDDAPITMKGAARYNIANALGAILVATQLGISNDAIHTGLVGFANTPKENPGRGNLFEFGGVHVLVDFAHNPHGLTAFADLVATFPAKRRLLLLGQAGDRDDESIREMTRKARSMKPDHVIIKEMTCFLRGRKPGEIPAVIERELRNLGAPPSLFSHAKSEMDAVVQALEWSQPGDLLLLFLHAERTAVLALLDALKNQSWSPGDAVRK